jgi:spore germination protein KB
MKEKIDRLQYFFMLPNMIFGKAIGITVGVIVRKIGADVWTAMSIGFVIALVFMVLMVYVSSKFPDKTMIDYGKDLLGKWMGKLLAIILALYFAFAYAVSANVMTMHLKEYFLTETPFIVLCILYTLVCTYGVILGPEVVIRFSIFGFIMIWGINITMVLGTMADFSFVNLQPIFDRGITANIINSIYVFSDTTMLILAIGMTYPMINKKKKIMPITIASMAAAFISVIIWPFLEVGVLGSDVMKQFVVVCMQQVRSAQLTRYLPRYELIMVSFFIWSVFVQSVMMFFSSVYSIKTVFNIKKDRWITYVLTPISIFLANWMGRDHNDYIKFLASPWTQISAALGMGLPLVFLLALIIKKMRNKSRKKGTKEV